MESTETEPTKEEMRWIRRLERCLKAKPERCNLYGVDSDLAVCIDGISDNDFSYGVGKIDGYGNYLKYQHEGRF